MTVAIGSSIAPDVLSATLASNGYRPDERVDETGEFAARGAVIDVFPAGYYLPVRINHEDGRVKAIASFDAASQRTTDLFDQLVLRPVSEAVLRDDQEGNPAERCPGLEHRLPELYPALDTIFDYAPNARISFDERAEARDAAFAEQMRDAYGSRLSLDKGETRPLSPERLYLDEAERERLLSEREVIRFEMGASETEPSVPVFALAPRPVETLAAFARAHLGEGRRVVVAGPVDTDVDAVSRRLERLVGRTPQSAADWTAVLEAEPGAVLRLDLPVTDGFVTREAAVIAVADVLGSRAAAFKSGPVERAENAFEGGDEPFRVGDAVIHLAHGVGILRGLETVDAGEIGATDMIRLEYAGDTRLLAPVDEVEFIWVMAPRPEPRSTGWMGGPGRSGAPGSRPRSAQRPRSSPGSRWSEKRARLRSSSLRIATTNASSPGSHTTKRPISAPPSRTSSVISA